MEYLPFDFPKLLGIEDILERLCNRRSGSACVENLVLKFRYLSIHGRVPNGVPPGRDDGWGFLSYKNALPTYLMKSIEPAWKGQKYELATEKIVEDEQTIMLHLRKVFDGHHVCGEFGAESAD